MAGGGVTGSQHCATLVVTANHCRYLIEALTSVIAQTTHEFDTILCADSTGDPRVAEIFTEFLSYLPDAVMIEVVGGTAGKVRNGGFGAACTPWVLYLDGDDVLRPDAMATMLAAIAETSADMISSGMYRIRSDGLCVSEPDSLTYYPPRWIYQTDPELHQIWTYFNQFLAIRTELWRAYPFDESANGEDVDFMLHQLLAGRFVKVPAAVYGYRDTPNSFSKRVFPEEDLCTRRYKEGYYAELFARKFSPAVAANFRAVPGPETRP
jgi:cellulose synthase/poly-beta-1,6-N-acetylglucosamine synthase-like glycosyltransferase